MNVKSEKEDVPDRVHSFNTALYYNLANSPWFFARKFTGHRTTPAEEGYERERSCVKCLLSNFLHAEEQSVRWYFGNRVIPALLGLYGKREAFQFHIKRLNEYNEKRLAEKGKNGYRDHVVHSLYVYLLGHYLIDKSAIAKMRKGLYGMGTGISKLIHADFVGLDPRAVDYFDTTLDCVWLLASLLHDVGYSANGKGHGAIGSEVVVTILNDAVLSLFGDKETPATQRVKKVLKELGDAIFSHDRRSLKINHEDRPYHYLLVLADALQVWDRTRETERDYLGPYDIDITLEYERGKDVISFAGPTGVTKTVLGEVKDRLESAEIEIRGAD